MSYNGSGVFNLYTPGNPVVTGTTISSTWANNTLTDIATGLSTAITKNGQTTITANIPMAGFIFTGLGAGTAAGHSVRYEQVLDWTSGAALVAATQAQQETGSSTVTIVTPGRQQYHPSAAKAWGTAAGNGSSLLASYNVASITDGGTGDILFAYTTAFSSANYAAIIMSEQPGAGYWCYPYAHTTTAIRALNLNAAGTQADPANPYSFAAFGDQA